MILPSAYWITLLVLLFSLICWGSWPNTLKKSGWRFELFYLDYALGCAVTAVVAAFTLGSMGSDISVQDNFLLAGKKQLLLVFSAGCVFSLGNMMLLGAMELAGMSVAFPLAFGLAVAVGATWNFFLGKAASAVLSFGGSASVLMAVILTALAYSAITRQRRTAERAALEAQNNEGPLPNPNIAKTKKPAKSSEPSTWQGVALALVSGVFMGSFYPLVTTAMEGDLGLTNPYAVALVFSIGILVSCFIYNLYFMNLPVKGLPISFFAYFTGTMRQHMLGWLGGLMWMAGGIASFVGSAATGAAMVGPGMSFAIGQGAAIVAFLWGYYSWNEFEGADSGVRLKLALMVLFFILGLGAVAAAALS